MEEERAAVEASLKDFGSKLDAVESALRPLLAAVDEVRSGGASDDIPPLMQARVDATLAYALNAIFCMYLRTQGVDPTTHPVREEISRVRSAYVRIQDIDAGRRAKPRKRSHASLFVAEKELAKVLTDGERALHQAVNGRLSLAGDVGVKKTFVDSSDEEEKGDANGDGEGTKTPKAMKRKRSSDEGDSSGESDDESGSDDGVAAAAEESAKKEKKRRKSEKKERKERKKEKLARTPKSDRKERDSGKKKSKEKKEKSGKKSDKRKKSSSSSP